MVLVARARVLLSPMQRSTLFLNCLNKYQRSRYPFNRLIDARAWLGSTFQRQYVSNMNRLLFEREHEETRPIVPGAVIAEGSRSASNDSIGICLNGVHHDLANTYLRDSCQCSRCVDRTTTQKTFNTGDIPSDIKYNVSRIIQNTLEVIWTDGHRSVFPAQFLAKFIDRGAAGRSRKSDSTAVTWDAQDIASRNIRMSYQKYMSSDAAVHQVVTYLKEYGLAFLESCPSGSKAGNDLVAMVERIGPLKSTFYGQTWNVQAVESAKNVAYTSVDLDLHMDLLYYESPPGLQFLHCLQNEVEGGSSIFVDSFKVAEVMRQDYPAEFDILTKYNVNFKYDNDGVHYHQSRPTFVIEPDTGELAYVNYSPPFQGIQCHEGFSAYQQAISVFAKLLADQQYRFELILRPGQCVIFNNRRTLHARRSFSAGRRWLKGAYADIDVLNSKYRTGQL